MPKLDVLLSQGVDSIRERTKTETTLWEDGYSWWGSLGPWAIGLVLMILSLIADAAFEFPETKWFMVFSGFVVLYAGVLTVYRRCSVKYELTDFRLIKRIGMFRINADRMELSDIDDLSYEQTFVQRLLGQGTIQIASSDRSHPFSFMYGIDNVEAVFGQIDAARRRVIKGHADSLTEHHDDNREDRMTSDLNDKIGLSRIAGTENELRTADVVFVHGLGGGSQTTWAKEGKPEYFWPTWIADEFPMLGVWTLGYGTTVSAWQERSMPLADLGNQVLEELHVEGVGNRPVIFVTHSMGGLVVKQILDHAEDQGVRRWKKIAEQTRGVAFLATPHSGSNLANFADFVRIVLRSTEQTTELKQHSSRLRAMHGSFLRFVEERNVICRTFAERREVKPGITLFHWNVKIPKGILVVDETSAEPNISGERAIPLDEDHISICKPIDRDTQIYRYVRSFLKECIESIENRE